MTIDHALALSYAGKTAVLWVMVVGHAVRLAEGHMALTIWKIHTEMNL